MRKFLLASLGLALLCSSSSWAQVGVKDLVKRQLNQANETRDEQARQNGVELAPVNKLASTQPNEDPGVDPVKINGWTERLAPDGTKVRLYFAHPRFAANNHPNYPGLLVIQEWWGVNEDIQQRTNEFAAKGYYAVAVDLYDGKVTKDPKVAAEYKAGLTDEAALVRTKTGMDYLAFLASQGLVKAEHTGVIGWCMGGEQALKLSVADPRVKATAIFYGALITDAEQLKALQGPVLGIFGNLDKSPAPESVNAFEAALKADQIPVEIHRYDNVGHAFASRSAAAMGAYHEVSAADAWAKTFVWLNKTLKNPPAPATTAPAPGAK